jgi:hypothetical protein
VNTQTVFIDINIFLKWSMEKEPFGNKLDIGCVIQVFIFLFIMEIKTDLKPLGYRADRGSFNF